VSGIEMFGPPTGPDALVPDAVPTPLRRGRTIGAGLRRNPAAVTGLAIVGAMSLAALLAPLLAPHDPNAVDLAVRFQSPSWAFPLGTDELGRDIASRMVFGARLSIASTMLTGGAISAIGLGMGLVAGYLGRLADTVISRTIDALLAFPAFLLALVLTGLLGPGLAQVMLAIIVVGWAGYARVVRSTVGSERTRGYVEAARALGSSRPRIVRRHVLPAVAGPILVLTSLQMGAILLIISEFSFVGLGVGPPTAEWGSMLREAGEYLGRAPYMMIPPGAAIFALVLGFNLVGDGLRDLLDPKATGTGRRR